MRCISFIEMLNCIDKKKKNKMSVLILMMKRRSLVLVFIIRVPLKWNENISLFRVRRKGKEINPLHMRN